MQALSAHVICVLYHSVVSGATYAFESIWGSARSSLPLPLRSLVYLGSITSSLLIFVRFHVLP